MQTNRLAYAADADGHLLEIVLRWQGRVTDVRRLLRPGSVFIGTSAFDTLCVPVEGGSHELLTSSGELRLPPGARVLDPPGAALVFGLGLHTLELRRTERSRKVAVVAAFDAFWGNVLVVVTLGIAALIAALLLLPTGMDSLDDDLLSNPARFQTLILKPRPQDSPFLDRLRAPNSKMTAQQTATTSKQAKQAKQAKKATASPPPRRSDAEIVDGKLGELFGDGDGVAGVLGGGGEVLAAAIGSLTAGTVAGRDASGALGFRNSVPGASTGTLHGGRISTRGRGDGDDDYGAAGGGLTDGVDGRLDPDRFDGAAWNGGGRFSGMTQGA